MVFFEKSQPAPTCLATEQLKASGTYNCDDVLVRLQQDFKNKCYICEQKAPTSIHIEHFKPHKGNVALKFDWNNLFFSCAHCNTAKGANSKYDDILNCTIVTDAVDIAIKHSINPLPKEKPIFTAINNNNDSVCNTISLLDAVYFGNTINKQLESANLRALLLKEIRRFNDLLFEYYDDNYSAEEKHEFKNKVARELKNSSAFTAFKRWVIRDNEVLRLEFNEYI